MSTRPAPLARRLTWAGVVALVATIADQATKQWALAALDEGHPVPLLSDLLTLQLTRNSGAAFSLGASTTWIFTLLAVVIMAALVAALWRVRHSSTAAAIGLLAGGAFGNLIDRMCRPPAIGSGQVIDFINYNGLFVGNVADIWIVIAAAWLAWDLTVRSEPGDEGEANSESEERSR